MTKARASSSVNLNDGTRKGRFADLPFDCLKHYEDNPNEMDKNTLAELVESIRTYGNDKLTTVIPDVYAPDDEELYIIVNGNQNVRAMRILHNEDPKKYPLMRVYIKSSDELDPSDADAVAKYVCKMNYIVGEANPEALRRMVDRAMAATNRSRAVICKQFSLRGPRIGDLMARSLRAAPVSVSGNINQQALDDRVAEAQAAVNVDANAPAEAATVMADDNAKPESGRGFRRKAATQKDVETAAANATLHRTQSGLKIALQQILEEVSQGELENGYAWFGYGGEEHGVFQLDAEAQALFAEVVTEFEDTPAGLLPFMLEAIRSALNARGSKNA